MARTLLKYVGCNGCRSHTRLPNSCAEWGEVNELKHLFRPSQPWTRTAVNAFVVAAWNRVGFN